MNQNISLITAYIAGLTAFFSPCLLPLLPSYFSIITGFTFKDLYGLNFDKIRPRVFLSSFFFVVGFSMVFTLLGLTTSIIGQYLIQNIFVFIRLSGLILIILGLVQLGVFHFESLQYDYAWNVQKKLARLGYVTAFATGAAFAFIWIPCLGQILGAILILASQSETTTTGGTLLLAFSLGLGSPFLLLGLFFPQVFKIFRDYRKAFLTMSKIAGIVMILFGILLLLDQYSLFLGFFNKFMYNPAKDIQP